MPLPTANNEMKLPSCFRKHNLVETQFANLGKSKRRSGFRRLAYCKIEGTKRPGIIYVPGYFSRMYIAKANVLEEYCLKNGYSFIKYDPEGIGESRTDSEVSFTEWYEDACYVVEHLTDGPQILVGPSNGAWMSLLLAAKYPGRVHSMVMLAPAVNHGLDDDLFERLLQALDKETADRVRAGETIRFGSNWGVEVTASKRFLAEMKEFRINMKEPLDVKCPVRIIHAMQDQSIHWENCLQLLDAVPHEDVRLYLKKRGNHRLMAEEDLRLEIAVVEELLTQFPAPSVPAASVSANAHLPALPQALMDGLMSEMGKRRTLAGQGRGLMRSKL
ncbi:mycophenolic acid acyl-glucuronide esterase, mitochondrial-like [Pollicipes pollicipes]|uniref:mycophenolic acid acyl-glucuronide esterase, mitochondrial-like n=1 Tax=Pollicipes pollicipes TaxID=41117 RepID=UPI00188537AC|nr:mycophenolic acid acyl-glucuronide esterase, mitochondrial-like [Pollicipes pollicipes]